LDTCTGVSEKVLSSCDALYEVPYSNPAVEDRGQLMVTNFRVAFVPYQSTTTKPVSRTVYRLSNLTHFTLHLFLVR